MKYVEIHYDEGVTLKGYLYEKSPEMPYMDKRPAVVVCPGGGYVMCSDREGDPIAAYFSGAGFDTFVFTYSLHEKAAFPRPLVELSRAMKDIRFHAEEWGVDADKIAVCGFSAGGHLVASLGTLWNLPEVAEQSGCEQGENQPNALVLGYPVINKYSWMSPEIDRLVGDRDKKETVDLLCTDRHVGPQTPPAFIFHTYADNCVAVEDTMSFANAMIAHDRPIDLHIFTAGCHGMATGDGRTGDCDPAVVNWMPMASEWLWRLFGRKDKAPFRFDEPRRHPENEVF